MLDRRNILWPVSGTGKDLAQLLKTAAGATHVSGGASEVVETYLKWAVDQIRMLQSRVSPTDLEHLITTRRYWATLADPTSVLTMVDVVLNELHRRREVLEASAAALIQQADAWAPRDGQFTNFVLVDTNFWMEKGTEQLADLDWHDEVSRASGRGAPAMQDELRIVVPLLVIDELDAHSHRRETRPKVLGATRFLYEALGDRPELSQLLRPASTSRGAVTMQLLFDPVSHVRLPHNDDELVERLVALKEFLGHPDQQMFFLTYDGGAAFRASAAGLVARHAKTPSRP
jgi:hypothetical protein